jgi:histidine ammonia-lyase
MRLARPGAGPVFFFEAPATSKVRIEGGAYGSFIMSSNAYGAAVALLAALDVRRLLTIAPGVFALSLEGLNGNIAPFLAVVGDVRPYASQQHWATKLLKELEGSFLWECTSNGMPGVCDDKRALQDPLSYRTWSYVMAAADDALTTLLRTLAIQINHRTTILQS